MKSGLLKYNAWFYRNVIPKYWKTTGIDGTAWENENKVRGKLDLNLESVIGIVITLEIAKGKLMYGRGICKNPKRYPSKSFRLKFIPNQSDLFGNLFPRQSELIRVNPKKVFNLV